jgi:hypothetical protein
MAPRLSISALTAGILLTCAAGSAGAQQLIGYVNTRDAEVTGATDVLNGQAVLMKSAGITARDHTAPITLGRGGTVRVCQTSQLHLTESKSADVAAPLLFSLDRGAIEIQMNSALNDAIMTPDLRFTIVNKGPLDLRLRVARNGDTCVENRGQYAPTLNISDPFGETMYQVAAGQHVLFEHGSLHEVVDKEQYPCGCPEPQGMSIADALLASGGAKPAAPAPAPAPAPPPAPAAPPVAVAAPALPAAPAAAQIASPQLAPPQPIAVGSRPLPPQIVQAQQQAELQSAEQAAAAAAMRAAEAKHPFPAAISEGLAQPAEAPPPAPGAPRPQIADSLSYNAAAPAETTPAAPARGKKAPKAKAAAKQPAAAKPAPAPKAASQPANDLVHVVGRFFKRLFGR